MLPFVLFDGVETGLAAQARTVDEVTLRPETVLHSGIYSTLIVAVSRQTAKVVSESRAMHRARAINILAKNVLFALTQYHFTQLPRIFLAKIQHSRESPDDMRSLVEPRLVFQQRYANVRGFN